MVDPCANSANGYVMDNVSYSVSAVKVTDAAVVVWLAVGQLILGASLTWEVHMEIHANVALLLAGLWGV
jgi:hypothetical protein